MLTRAIGGGLFLAIAVVVAGAQVTTDGSTLVNYIPYFKNSAIQLSNSPITVSGSNVGIGTTAPLTTLDVRGSGSFGRTTLYNGGQFGIDAFYNIGPTANVQATNAVNGENDTANNFYSSYQSIGVGGVVRYGGSASENGSGKGARAIDGSMFVYNSGITAYASGFRSDVRNLSTGTVTNLQGVWITGMLNTGGGTVTTTYGLRVDDQTGVGTANYGAYLATSSGANNYNVYAVGTAQNYFAGNVGIGTTSPGAKLEVNGGLRFTSDPSGTVQTSAWTGVLCGGDYAEAVDPAGDLKSYVPGDVLVISDDQNEDVRKAAEPYSTMVAGIYATKPGVVGRRESLPMNAKDLPMAMVGIVPTNVTAENGAIHRGDLLVTSSRPGYAMKGTDRSRLVGAVIGKAMGSLDSGSGVIEVLVTLQ